MDYDPVPILLYYGGTITHDSNGAKYEDASPHIIHENPKITFVELKRRIYAITKWPENLYDIGISARWQAGRGHKMWFVLIPVTDDVSLGSVIRNTQAGKIDWSLVELYLEKLSKGAGGSSQVDEIDNRDVQNCDSETPEERGEFDFPSSHDPAPIVDEVELNEDARNVSRETIIGVVRTIVCGERNTFEGACVNNELADLDDGDEAYPEEEDEDGDDVVGGDDEHGGDVLNFRPPQGKDIFRRSTSGFFLEVDDAFGDVRGGYGPSKEKGDFYKVQEWLGGRDELKNALDEWHVRNHRGYMTVKSGPLVYTVKCKQHDRCPWRLHASHSKKKGTLVVKSVVSPHMCVNANLSRDHQLLTSRFISRYILGLVKAKLTTSPAQIVETIKGQFGCNISYRKAWRAKCKASKHLFGGWREAYSILPKLIRAIEPTNRGTVYKVWSDSTRVEGTHILRGFFWAFGPAIRAFDSCRPLLSIDGTFLYGKYKGVLLIAMAVDANGQLMPVAYALVEKESIQTWTWFMNIIRELVTQREGICVISDRHAGILDVFKKRDTNWAPPKAYHWWCTRHFAQNMYSAVPDKGLMEDLKKVASENQLCKFDKGREELEKGRPRVRNYLTKHPLPKWSLAHDAGGRRFGMMNTNISEVYNNVLKGARGLPVAAIVELTFYRTNEYFRKRRTIANASLAEGTVWVDKIVKHLERKRDKSNKHHVSEFDDGSGLYQIVTPVRWIEGTRKGGRTHTVNLEKGECTCGKPQLLHYPCSHLLAACLARALDYSRFISPFYSVEMLAQTWSHKFQPLKDSDYWEEYDGPNLIPDESMKHVKRGRRQSRRLRNDMDEMESQVKTRCSNCRQEGHNVRKCPARIGRVG